MKINIAYYVSDEKIQVIKSHLEYEQKYNPNYNGVEFEIERDDFTCISEGSGCEYEDTALLYEINSIIMDVERDILATLSI